MKIRIKWYKKSQSSVKGHGDWFDASKLATLTDAVDTCNVQYPDLHHEIEIQQPKTKKMRAFKLKLLNIWYTLLYQFDQHRNEIPEWWYGKKPFLEQPEWLQRVLVAQDVIAQIRIKRYRPNTGSYISNFKTDNNNYPENNDDVKSKFETIKRCDVCALGECLLSIVKFKNTLKFRDIREADEDNYFTYNSNIKTLISSLFTPEQIFLIEMAFERSSTVSFMARQYDEFDERALGWEIKERAYDFGKAYRDASDRLIAIMKNIIENKGTFKP